MAVARILCWTADRWSSLQQMRVASTLTRRERIPEDGQAAFVHDDLGADPDRRGYRRKLLSDIRQSVVLWKSEYKRNVYRVILDHWYLCGTTGFVRGLAPRGVCVVYWDSSRNPICWPESMIFSSRDSRCLWLCTRNVPDVDTCMLFMMRLLHGRFMLCVHVLSYVAPSGIHKLEFSKA